MERGSSLIWLSHIVHGREGRKLTVESHVVGDNAEDLGCHGKEVGVLFRSHWRTN